MSLKSFLIYRSSAGSGKTYTLAKSFLKLALQGKGKFRRILGVTFTNKATEEMKQRIIKFLSLLKDGKDQKLVEDLCEDLKIDESALKKRSAQVLSEILHDYSRFSIVTIDSFFHQVIRAFAREMGLQGTFSIELETDAVMQQVIDRMLSEIGEDEHKLLKQWLTQFAEEKVEEGTSWDFRKDIATLATEVLKDDFKSIGSDISDLAERPDQLIGLKKELDKIQYTFENTIKKICSEAFKYLDKNGLSVDKFKSKGNGPAGLFIKFDKKEYEITEKRRAASNDPDAWVKKTDKQKDLLEKTLNEFVLPKYNELIDFYDKKHIDYYSALELKRYFYAFGILSYISQYLQIYRDEHDAMLISDLPDFLSKIIADSDTPYIYEKVGSRFDHYLIDEFQDTSSYQWNNFKPLVKNATDQGQFCMVVGDAKQSIYRFRGGDWQLLQHQVKHDIGEAITQEANLSMNWRSTSNIINFNNTIFQQLKDVLNASYIDDPSERVQEMMQEVLSSFKDSYQQLPEGKNENEGLVSLSFLNVDRGADENYKELAIQQTIAKVEELQKAGYALRDVAILTRTAQEGRDIARAFIEYSNSDQAQPGLRYDVVSKEALFLTSSHVVQFIISVIIWLHDEKNHIELAHWYATYQKYMLGNKARESDLYLQLDQWDKHVPAEFVRKRHQLRSLPLYELVEEICRLFKLSKIKEEYTYLQGFQDAVLDYTKNERGDIAAFLVWWEEVRKNRSIIISDDNNAIKILTIHKSKGLEFPIVILPFLNWSLDKSNKQAEKIMWCEGVDKTPFNKMPVVPLRYGSSLEKTFWAEDYYREKLRNLLDNLNLLYVALTRPEKSLFMFAPEAKADKLNNVNDLMLQLVSKNDGWNAENQYYELGALPAPTEIQIQSIEVSLKDYTSHSWRNKVQLQMKNGAEEREKHFNEAVAYGLKMHVMLSKIKYKTDIEQFKADDLYADIKYSVTTLSEYFDPSWEVRTEVPVLLPNGEQRRIDRFNKKANQIVLIDYKTGSQRTKDQNQMKEYLRIVGEMTAMPVSGLLLYLENQEVLNVEAGK